MRHLLDRLRKMPLKERAGVPGLSPDRADIIVAGLAIVDRVMERFDVNAVQVHNRGVRDGLLLTMIDRSPSGTRTDKPHDRDAAIERLALKLRLRDGAQPARGQAGRLDLCRNWPSAYRSQSAGRRRCSKPPPCCKTSAT